MDVRDPLRREARLQGYLGEHPGVSGVIDVMRDDVAVARNVGPPLLGCHLCSSADPSCPACLGLGFLGDIPYVDEPWSEVMPNLWVGGHRVASWDNHRCVVGRQFDLVVSLHQEPGYGPLEGVDEIRFLIPDAVLDPRHHDEVDILAETVYSRLTAGDRVLVRCLAGINRSAMVAARVMMMTGDDGRRGDRQDPPRPKPLLRLQPVVLFVPQSQGSGVNQMSLRKHGEGSVVPADEDVKKVASAEPEGDRERRLAALQQENQDADQ